MKTIFFKTSVGLLILSSVLGGTSNVYSAEFTINDGQQINAPQTLNQAEKGEIAKNSSLDVDGVAILQSGASQGVIINNNGTIKSTSRAIDTDNKANERNIQLNNNGLIDSNNDSFRIRNDVSSGNIDINNNGTITSQTGQVFNFSQMKSADAVINIINNGSIIAVADNAMAFGAGAIHIDNSGIISASKRGINVNQAGELSSFELINNKTGIIESSDDAIRISALPKNIENILITNYGRISTIGANSGQALDLNAAIAKSIHIKNYGLIEADDADAIRSGQGGIVENWGTIVARSVLAEDSKDGIDFQDENSGTVFNREGGAIIGARHGITGKIPILIINEKGGLIFGQNGSGLNFDTAATSEAMDVVNYGVIRGAFNHDASYGDGDGVDVDGSAHIQNYGEIYGDGSIGTKEGDISPATSEAIAIGGGLIVNGSAQHRNALISGVDNGILVDDSETGPAFAPMTITNFGRIEGRSGYGVRIISNDKNQINNYGQISGTNGYAVIFGDGDDTFIYQNGSSVVGVVEGGNGQNTLNFGEVSGEFDIMNVGDTAIYRQFNKINFAEGSTWRFNGSSTFAGDIYINQSNLYLNNTMMNAANVHIGAGATVMGSSHVQSLTMDGGVLIIDRDINNFAKFHSEGDITLANNAKLYVNGANYNQILTSNGKIQMDGSPVLNINNLGGCYALGGCTLFSAQHGISGRLKIDSNFAFLTPQITYNQNDVNLSFVRNNNKFSTFVITHNQYQTAHALDQLSPINPVVSAIAVLKADEVTPALFDNLSGEIYGATRTSMLLNSYYVRDAINTRMIKLQKNLAQGPVWLSTWGHSGHIDGSLNKQKSSNDGWGITAGFDGFIKNTVFAGFILGYENTSIKDVRHSKSDVDSFHLGAYAMGEVKNIQLRGGVVYSYLDAQTDRHIYIPNLKSTARDDYKGWKFQVFAEASYDLTVLDKTVLSPYFNIAHVWLKFDDAFEHGALANLSIEGETDSVTFTTLGMRSLVNLDEKVVFFADLAWQHAFGDIDGKTTNRFMNTSESFKVQAVGLDEDMAILGAGFNFKLNDKNSLELSYKGQVGSNISDHTGKLVWNLRF